MKIVNVLTGIRLTVFIRMLLRNGFSFYPKYFLRVLFLIPNSLLSSLFTGIEKIKFNRKIKQTVIEYPPVVIIGHWRTGTTYLHQLMNLDPNLTAPTTTQVAIPDQFIFSTRYYTPVMKLLMASKRPMDNVKLSPDEPMEDEFALLRMGAESPLEKLFFPSGDEKFLSGIADFIPRGRELEKWKNCLVWFIKKITLVTNRRVVLKNPFHTQRIRLIREMFPGVKFIHIYRHPCRVVPSTIHMWNVVSGENAFKKGWQSPTIEETCRVISLFFKLVKEESKSAENGSFCEVKFEDLETDPAGEIKRIYTELGLEYTGEFDRLVREFACKSKSYRKNEYSQNPEEKKRIYNGLKEYFDYYNYPVE